MSEKIESQQPKPLAELVGDQCKALADKYTNEKDKSDLVARLSPKIIDNYRDSPKLKTILDQWVMQKFFGKYLNDKKLFDKMKRLNEDLNWDDKDIRAEAIWKIKTLVEAEITKVENKEIQKTNESNIEKKTKESQILDKALDAQNKLKSNPEFANAIKTTLEPDEKTHIMDSLGLKTEADLQAKIDKIPAYKEANLTTDNLLSFFHTQKQIADNPELKNKAQQNPDFIAFDRNFQTIQKDLNLFPQPKTTTDGKLDTSNGISAQTMTNLSDKSFSQLTQTNESLAKFAGLDKPEEQKMAQEANIQTIINGGEPDRWTNTNKKTIHQAFGSCDEQMLGFLNTGGAKFDDYQKLMTQKSEILKLQTQLNIGSDF